MSFLDKFGGSIISGVKELADEFHLSGEEKNAFALESKRLVLEQFKSANDATAARLGMVQEIIKSEMDSGDNYTKRARPTLVYFGMVVIFFNYCLVPAAQALTSTLVEPFMLPLEFWVAWGGTVGIWSAGRSAEKTVATKPRKEGGLTDKLLSAINGD